MWLHSIKLVTYVILSFEWLKIRLWHLTNEIWHTNFKSTKYRIQRKPWTWTFIQFTIKLNRLTWFQMMHSDTNRSTLWQSTELGNGARKWQNGWVDNFVCDRDMLLLWWGECNCWWWYGCLATFNNMQSTNEYKWDSAWAMDCWMWRYVLTRSIGSNCCCCCRVHVHQCMQVKVYTTTVPV